MIKKVKSCLLEGQENLKEDPLLQEPFLLRRNFVLGYCRPLSKWFLKEGLLQKCLDGVTLIGCQFLL